MKSAIAEFLRHQRPRSLLMVGAGCLAAAAIPLTSLETRTLRPFTHLLALLLAIGGVALGLAAVRSARDFLGRVDERRRGAVLAWGVGSTVVALVLTAFSVYSLSFYWKETRMYCWEAEQGRSPEQRRIALSVGESRLRSPFSLLPEWVGFRVSSICQQAAHDLQRIDRGNCPAHLMPGFPCQCGPEHYPAHARCEHPECVNRGKGERLYCWDDP